MGVPAPAGHAQARWEQQHSRAGACAADLDEASDFGVVERGGARERGGGRQRHVEARVVELPVVVHYLRARTLWLIKSWQGK